MLKTILLLLASLIVVPFISFKFDQGLTADQWEILIPLLWMCLVVALSCFTLSELTKNYSQVDKIWSLVPILYVGFVAYKTGWAPRLSIMFLLTALWGLRLTYNFSRRGGYSWKFWTGEEDYRWAVLRAKPELSKPWAWRLFNLFFISLYQNYLILFFTLPAVVAARDPHAPLEMFDYALAGLILLFIGIETVADQQQWVYQQEKYRRRNAGETLGSLYETGFTHTGLWRWMRHPNYMAEQAIWVCFYFFGVAATGAWVNWSLSGALLLLVLFQGSADFSEGISKDKYPLYKAYCMRVGRFIPTFWKNPDFK